MMDFGQHLKIQSFAADFVKAARATGAVIETDNDSCQLLTAVADAARQGRSTRAFDHSRARSSRRIERDELEVNPADEARASDEAEDLESVHGLLRKYLAAAGGTKGDRRFIQQLADALQGYLKSGNDADTLCGRGMRDQERDGRSPWELYERDATAPARARLAHDRRLATRATDRTPAGRSFLGMRPEPGSDLARIDAQAAATFNL